jgi:hypothetical protein
MEDFAKDRELECYLEFPAELQITKLEVIWEFTGIQEDVNELERLYNL